MKKNTIQLNEPQLREIVAESVKKVLSEIDWKTYANAAKKSDERGRKAKDDRKWDDASKNFNRAKNFKDAALNSFNDAHGALGIDGGPESNSAWIYGMNNLDNNWTSDGATTSLYSLSPNNDKDKPAPSIAADISPNTYRERYYNDNVFSPEALDTADKGNQEVKNYMRDKYEYKKGKGWQLKNNNSKNSDHPSTKINWTQFKSGLDQLNDKDKK